MIDTHHILHVAYGLTALSFAVRDLIWLRTLAIVASLITIVILLIEQSEWHNAPFLWNCVFFAINGWRLFMLIYGEKSVRLNEDEQELHETLFRGLSKLEFMKLLRTGVWRQAHPGDVLAKQNEPIHELMLISNGRAKVQIGGREVALIKDGQFIGEMSFLTHDPASATVTAVEPTKYLAWPKDALRDMLHRNPTMRVSLTGVMGTDLSRKLRSSPAAPPSGPSGPGTPGIGDSPP